MAMDDGHWGEDVARWQDEGYAVSRLPVSEAKERFLAHCERYPHMPWQKRNEAARAKTEPKLWP
jgi:8-oxo-dGTP pyrophosphatase MutT (NUDIX family)